MILGLICALVCSKLYPVASFGPRASSVGSSVGLGSFPTTTKNPRRAKISCLLLASSNDGNNDLWYPNNSRQPNDEAAAIAATSATVPMDTPARASLPNHLRLEAIPGKGLGVITTVPIPCNTMVGDYVGEVISTPVRDRRYLPSQEHLQDMIDLAWKASRQARGQTISGDYLYAVTMPGGADPIYMDAEDEYESLWTRFINHASPPNNNLTPKSIHESYDGKPRVWFVANRDIAVGEELCFDYGEDYWLPGDQVI